MRTKHLLSSVTVVYDEILSSKPAVISLGLVIKVLFVKVNWLPVHKEWPPVNIINWISELRCTSLIPIPSKLSDVASTTIYSHTAEPLQRCLPAHGKGFQRLRAAPSSALSDDLRRIDRIRAHQLGRRSWTDINLRGHVRVRVCGHTHRHDNTPREWTSWLHGGDDVTIPRDQDWVYHHPPG